MKVVIVDDEPRAIALIDTYLSHFSNFEVVSTFRNPLKALEFLNLQAVDVIFLDINMPGLSGISLSKMIAPQTMIVFTTAYSEYAVESYDVNAIDYLLKPIELERFSQTILKIMSQVDAGARQKVSDQKNRVVFLKSGGTIHRVMVAQIRYLQKDGNYMMYFLDEKKILVRQNIAEALHHLTNDFMQVQKSYIVNIPKVDAIDASFLQIGNDQIPIGPNYKAVVRERFR